MEPALFKLNEVVLDSWRVFFYEDFSSLFLKEGQLDADFKKALTPFLEEKFNDYRAQLHFKGTAFLVGFFHRDREIRFYTPRLNTEFTLLQANKEFSESSVFIALKRHTDKVASLSPTHFPTALAELTERFKLPDLFRDAKYRDVQQEVLVLREQLIEQMGRYSPSLLERVTDLGLDLVTRFQGIRVHLLKFLTALPALEHDKSRESIKKLLQESLRNLVTSTFKRKHGNAHLENWFPIGLAHLSHLCIAILAYIPAKIIAWNLFLSVRIMAKRFIAGVSLDKAEKAMRRLYKSKRDATLDQLGETVLTEEDADLYLKRCLQLIRGFSKYVSKGELNASQIYRANVSVKVTALSSQVDPYDFDKTYASIGPRLKTILLAAKEEKVFIMIDAEHFRYRDLVFNVYKKILLETKELEDFSATGIVLQGYLRSAYEHFLEILELAKTRKLIMPIRLVKGAYWDAETLEAEGQNLSAWHFLNKEETDLHFRQLIYKILENYSHVQLSVASHNFSDHAYSEALRNKFFTQHPPVEHQCLDMTYEALSVAMARLGWVVRNYVPVGDYLVGMAYFVRRILENSSQVGILSQMRSADDLRAFPTPEEIYVERLKKGEMRLTQAVTDLSSRFLNMPTPLFFCEEERKFYEGGKPYQASLPSKDSIAELERLVLKYKEGQWNKTTPSFRATFFFRLAFLLMAKKADIVATLRAQGYSALSSLKEYELIIDGIQFYVREELLFLKKNPQALSRGVWVIASSKENNAASLIGALTATLMSGNNALVLIEKKDYALMTCLADLLKELSFPEGIISLNENSSESLLKTFASHPLVAGMIYFGHSSCGLPLSSNLGRNLHEYNLEICQTQFLASFDSQPLVLGGQYSDLSDVFAGIKSLPSLKGLRVVLHQDLKNLFDEKIMRMNHLDHRKWEIYFYESLEQAVSTINGFDFVGETLIYSESNDESDFLRAHIEVPNIQINKKYTSPRIGDFPENTMKLSGLSWRLGGKNVIDHFHVIPRQVSDVQLPLEGRGSDYQFCLARPSDQDPLIQFENLTRAFDNLIAHFEVLYPGVYGENKECLISFKNWIKDHFLRFRIGPRLNTPLSHLMNGDDFRLPLEEVLVLAFNEKPHFSVFVQTLAALSMGSGVTVITRNQQSFEWWTKFRDLFLRSGFSKTHFDVFFSTRELMERSLKHPCLGAVVFDGNFETLKKLLPLIFDEGATDKKRLRRLFTAYDAPSDNDFERLMMQFSQVRSLSINIMKQGAQMEIDTII